MVFEYSPSLSSSRSLENPPKPANEQLKENVSPGFQFHAPDANADTTLPPQIFRQDVALTIAKYTLPENSSHITSTPQLAYCLSLSLPSLVSKEGLNEIECDWSQARVDDPDEQERLKAMATDLVRTFVRDELKKSDVVAEIVSLTAVLDQEGFRELLRVFVDDIEQSVLLKIHLLDGLAHLIRNAAPGYINVDDLVVILELLSRRLKETHRQSFQHVYRLTMTVSRVLDSMVDSQVNDLKREQLHGPLSIYLKDLQASSDPYMIYQAAYAYQALQYILDDETILQAALRRTGKVVQGISGVVSAMKAIDLNGFIDGLKDIQRGLQGASEAMSLAKETYSSVNDLAEGGQNLLECLKEDYSFNRKSAWYPALRGLDMLVQEGKLAEFEKLVRGAPCRQDPAFQWGVCQRVGEIAAVTLWDSDVRQRATLFLGELYKDDAIWIRQASIKPLVHSIFSELTSSSDAIVTGHAQEQLQELEAEQSLSQNNAKDYPDLYPLVAILPPHASPLLDRVLDKPDVEAILNQLRRDRLEQRSRDVYISPRAKVSQKATEDFDLTSKVQEFLDSDKKVFLLLGDSGAGKSTFNKVLETSLWDNYEKINGRIPLFIHLPAIDKPEQDLIAKQLFKANFTEREIRELKANREFILICDGYDESQQTRNLYMSNQLNRTGGWRAQMVISCRTEYSGVDYKDFFQPTDRNSGRSLGLMQEAVIAPFNKGQIQDYIEQYVSSKKPSWESKDYIRALGEIQNLQDLVKNPFLLKLALEVLPTLVDIESDFSRARVTRVGLYDEFVAQWIERSKIRFGEVDLSHQDSEDFRKLLATGFRQQAITYLKELATAIYDNQSDNPVVDYSLYYDRGTWKEGYFSRRDGNSLLREAIPLVRDINQYRFIHKSVLEYGLTLAICDPSTREEATTPTFAQSRRGSASSILSFEIPIPNEGSATTVEKTLLESPLGRRSFVRDSSILQFLVERVQQQPVFKEQLQAIIQLSKSDKKARIGAANSITVLIQAGVQFNGADLRGVKIPGADLSYGMFDSVRFDGADLRKTNLRNGWFRQANFSGAQMSKVQFGELPYLQEDDKLNVCVFSPDDKTFSVGLWNGSFSVYDVLDWRRMHTLKGHVESVTSLVYSPEGDYIVSGANEENVLVWDVKTGRCIHTLEGHDKWVISVVYSPRGGQVASGSDDCTIRLWDVKTGNTVYLLQGHDERVTSLAYSPKGDLIASGSDDKTVRLWDVESGNCVHTLEGHTDWVTAVIYSPEGNLIASGSDDYSVRLWDAGTGNCVYTLEGHTAYIRSIAISPKGDQIASGSDDAIVQLWDTETGNCVHTLEGHGINIRSIMYSPRGDQIASGSDDNTVRLWDVESGNCIHILQGHDLWVASVVYSQRGDRIASGGGDTTVRLWDVDIGDRVRDLQGYAGKVKKVVHSPKGDQIASRSEDSTIRLWDVETGTCVHTLQGHSDNVWSIMYSSTGNQIASGSEDRTVRLWDVDAGKCVHSLKGHEGPVRSIAYLPKVGLIASGSDDKTIRLWDIETGSCVRNLQGHTDCVRIVVRSPKEDQIASGSNDNTIRLWNVETGNCIHTLQGHSYHVWNIVYSPKGNQIASGSHDNTIRLWDVETGDCIHTLERNANWVVGVVYSPKGDQIASGNDDLTIRLWDVETGKCVHTLQGHSGYVLIALYSPNGNMIASGSDDKIVRLWDVETGECLAIISSFDGAVESISWGNAFDQLYLVTGSNDRSVRRWQIINNPDGCKVQLGWSTTHGRLTVMDASFEDAQDLSLVNHMLLRQREALDTRSNV